jgi:hypothetical protein
MPAHYYRDPAEDWRIVGAGFVLPIATQALPVPSARPGRDRYTKLAAAVRRRALIRAGIRFYD